MVVIAFLFKASTMTCQNQAVSGMNISDNCPLLNPFYLAKIILEISNLLFAESTPEKRPFSPSKVVVEPRKGRRDRGRFLNVCFWTRDDDSFGGERSPKEEVLKKFLVSKRRGKKEEEVCFCCLCPHAISRFENWPCDRSLESFVQRPKRS